MMTGAQISIPEKDMKDMKYLSDNLPTNTTIYEKIESLLIKNPKTAFNFGYNMGIRDALESLKLER